MDKVEATVCHAEMLLFWTELLMDFTDWDLICLQKWAINAVVGSMMKTLNSLDNTAQLSSRKKSSKQVLTCRPFKVIRVTERMFHTNENYKSFISLVQRNEGGSGHLRTLYKQEEGEVFNLKKNVLAMINRKTEKLYK